MISSALTKRVFGTGQIKRLRSLQIQYAARRPRSDMKKSFPGDHERIDAPGRDSGEGRLDRARIPTAAGA
jgi:hypothetical protein